jgi:SAM-dependent methyltransferase
MQHPERWKPTKYVYSSGRLRGSRDPEQLGAASRLVADIIARFYESALEQHAKGRLLDLGCGSVPLYAAYQRFVTENVCVDWSHTPHSNVHLDYEIDLTQPLPFRDGEFDTILMSDVLEHIPVPERLWTEIARLLAGNGKVLMNVPFYYWLHEAPHDYYRYTEFALRRFVAVCGLRLIRLEPIGGVPEILGDIAAKSVCRLAVVGRPLAAAVQWAASTFGRTHVGQRVSSATSRRFPLGYFLVAAKTDEPATRA